MQRLRTYLWLAKQCIGAPFKWKCQRFICLNQRTHSYLQNHSISIRTHEANCKEGSACFWNRAKVYTIQKGWVTWALVMLYWGDILLLISLTEGFARGSRAAVTFAGLGSFCHHACIVHIRSPRRFCGCLGAISAQSCNLDWQWIAYNQPKKLFWTAKNDQWGDLREKPDEFTDWEKAKAHTQHSFDQSRWQQLCSR